MSLGGIIYPIIFHKLCDEIGFGWTVRAIGLVIFVTLLIPLLVFRVRVVPSSKRRLLDLAAFKEPAYTFFVLGGLLTFVSLNISSSTSSTTPSARKFPLMIWDSIFSPSLLQALFLGEYSPTFLRIGWGPSTLSFRVPSYVAV